MIHERGYFLDYKDMEGHRYDAHFADGVIQLIKNKVRTIIDIGCGNGEYTKRFISAGFDCKGFDGSPLTEEITGGLCKIADFSEVQSLGRFDLAFCIEVGEHIPYQFEMALFDNICYHSDYVILSWAIEGQGGNGHVNCRNNNYVIDKMDRLGYDYDAVESKLLRFKCSISWLKDTVMVFRWRQ